MQENKELKCPADHTLLLATAEPRGFGCSRCQGHLVDYEEIERKTPSVRLERIFESIHRASEISKRVCPRCEKPFEVVYTVALGKFVQLDACSSCRWVWFDRGEDRDLLTSDLSNSEIDQIYRALAISESKFRYWHVLKARGKPGLALLGAIVFVIAVGLVIEYFELQDFNRRMLAGDWKPPIMYGNGRGRALGYLFLDTPYRNSTLLMIALVVLFETRSRHWFFGALVIAAFALT